MGFFDSLVKVFSAMGKGKHKNATKNMPFKLIEPSIGRIVEFRITETDPLTAKLYLERLILYAKNLEQYGVEWEVTEKLSVIKMLFPSVEMAQDAREHWQK